MNVIRYDKIRDYKAGSSVQAGDWQYLRRWRGLLPAVKFNSYIFVCTVIATIEVLCLWLWWVDLRLFSFKLRTLHCRTNGWSRVGQISWNETVNSVHVTLIEVLSKVYRLQVLICAFLLLQAYSLVDREVGYCQGSAFIVGLLLMQVSHAIVFLCYYKQVVPL